jgi:tRNA(Ile)-lysidine synthase
MGDTQKSHQSPQTSSDTLKQTLHRCNLKDSQLGGQFHTRRVNQTLALFKPHLPLTVAYSGGADSTALLMTLSQRWPGQVGAVHVHHGLQSMADDFVGHTQAVCRAHAIPWHMVKVQAQPQRGQSPEDVARRARYEGLITGTKVLWQGECKNIALAQHADDQMETVLLALTRGAGVHGMAGMPTSFKREGLVFHRPFLSLPGQVLKDVVQENAWPFIDDPTNQNERFTRNRLRHTVLPALIRGFAGIHQTIARTAAHAAQAAELLDEMAAEDAQRLGQALENPVWLIQPLKGLSVSRRLNLLRAWLKAAYRVIPSTVQIQELNRQVSCYPGPTGRMDIKLGTGWICAQAGNLYWVSHRSRSEDVPS